MNSMKSSATPSRALALEAVGSLCCLSRRGVTGLDASEQFLIGNRPLERGTLRQITPAARIDEPLTVTNQVGLGALLPLHRLEDVPARGRRVVRWLRNTRYACVAAWYLVS